ncbi:MAG: Rpn family recombination-promoting nuclease/putative transposase [Lachnospiraceae bacterium]|nr:Rpn family recombination-promoting nuclease/putative transposase [Lachnospiraceae bacterium]
MGKTFDELTITDDFMFCKVMQNERICKRLLNSVLRDKIGEIAHVEYQKTIREDGFAKWTRMDVWVTDTQGRIFDVEMQTTDADNLAKRMRYYQSQIDILSLGKATRYEDLPDSFIIFFSPFDYPACSLPVYTFRTCCEEQRDIFLQDGAIKIMINSSAAEKEKNEDLRAFMDCMNETESEHPFAKEISQEVINVKENDVYRAEFFSWNAKAQDLENKGRKEGIKEVTAVYNSLKSEGRDSDAERFMTDESYRAQVLAERETVNQ